ncbi:hypothetical protein [Bradyrhizobium sp. LB13.1]
MHQPEIGQAVLSAGEITVPHKRASVDVAFDAMAFHQHDAIPRRLAEAVTAIGGDRDHGALQRERERLRHQAARVSERRF